MMTSDRTADVVIVGGGVIGCAIARRAARDGLSAVVVERGTPGMEASWAAAGMLSPLAEADGPGPFLDLLMSAREIYPSYAAALREETGVNVSYADAGTLFAALRVVLCAADLCTLALVTRSLLAR